MTGECNGSPFVKPSGGASAPGRRLEGEQCGAKLRYAPFPRQNFVDVAKVREAGGAWATDYVIAIKGKIEKPSTTEVANTDRLCTCQV